MGRGNVDLICNPELVERLCVDVGIPGRVGEGIGGGRLGMEAEAPRPDQQHCIARLIARAHGRAFRRSAARLQPLAAI